MMKGLQRGISLLLITIFLVSLAPAALAANYVGTINTDKVFFRIKPNTNAGYYAVFQKNAKVNVTGTSGDFYAVTYNGEKGYVMKKFVTLSSAAEKALNSSSTAASSTSSSSSGTGNATVNTDKVFFRLKPNTNAGYHGLLNKNTKVDVTGASGDFYAVTYNGQKGYIMKKFVTLSAAAEKALNSSSTAASSTSSSSSGTGNATINTDKVFFRLKPNTNAGYHGLLNKNTKVDVTGASGDFYAVTYNGDKGYVMKKFVTLSAAAKKELEKTESSSKYANVTTIKGLGDPPAFTSNGSSGDSVEKLQQALKIKGYYKDVVDGKFGTNTINAVKAYQKAVGISQTGKADYNTILKLFGKVGETTVSTDPKMNGITKISQIEVPKTTKKGNSGQDVIALQQALKIKGYYKAAIDGKYGDTTVEAVKAFQKSKKLSQDGVAGNETIKALFGKNAADYSYTTERLDWFNGGRSVIPRGATFTIKDVNTGKTFTARHLFGTNHLDAEPLTASDTATLKSLYGGSFSWNRRAILVKYNNHVYAASMNGMPHGSYTITDNNFDGQFCIHFYGSKTHGTDRVDPDHQAAEKRALNATW